MAGGQSRLQKFNRRPVVGLLRDVHGSLALDIAPARIGMLIEQERNGVDIFSFGRVHQGGASPIVFQVDFGVMLQKQFDFVLVPVV
jgi:hypothetical protein